MSKVHRLVFLVIGVLLLSLVVDAQPTVDDGGSCQSTCATLDETATARNVELMKEDLSELKNIKEDLTEVKNLLGSRQQSYSSIDSSSLSSCIPLLIQQNVYGSHFFNRSWAEFKVGFNDSRGNYWLGNELLHQLTNNGRYKLRVDLQALNGSWYYAEYSRFIVFSEAQNYKILVSVYSGNAGDALQYHNNMMFTTYDRDNDQWRSPSYKGNCAVFNGGGFWYRGCSRASVNTVRGRGENFRWWSVSGGIVLLQSSRMWLMC